MGFTNKSILLLLIFLMLFDIASAQEWQWSQQTQPSKHNNRGARAWLWVPPHCEKIKAVVLAQNNMEEISILENPAFRTEMARLDVAEIWVSPFFDHLFRFNEGSAEVFQSFMDSLATVSGYDELRYVPIIGMGHSAAASWPYYFAAWNPGRTLAALSVSGQWPYFRHASFAPDIWGGRTVDGVPLLECMGEYEAAATWSTEGLKERKEHPGMALSMLACPAEGHFATSDKKTAFLAFYIKKALQYRLPTQVKEGEAPILLPVNPKKTGWLADKWRFNEKPLAPAAPVGQYTGDTTQAFWFFDEETARAVGQYQSAFRDRKAPLIGYVQDGKIVVQRNTHQQVDLKFMPLADGITFKLLARFLDTVPGASARTADWTKLPAGSPLGCPAGAKISIDRIAGPFKKLNDSLFILDFQKSYPYGDKPIDLWFVATQPEADGYKPAAQQAKMTVPAANAEGIEQTIQFAPMPNVRAGKKTLKLQAVSSAGLPVHYYVKEGPAYMEGNTLKFAAIPPRSRFPLKVSVVAWQYGRSAVPKVKTAGAVEQVFYILK